MSSYEVYESNVLRKVFALTLDPAQANAGANPPITYLEQLAKELADELGTPGTQLLSEANLERVLMSRLSEPPASYPQWPVHYLIGCYGRAADELRSVSLLKGAEDQARLSQALGLARQLCISYAGFLLLKDLGMEDMFPQPEAAKERGDLQLLDSLEAAAASSAGDAFGGLAGGYIPGAESGAGGGSGGAGAQGGAVPMPAGFLDDFGARFEEEGLHNVAYRLGNELMGRCSRLSLLGDYAAPLGLLERLARCKPMARALTQTPCWLPGPLDGRTIEFHTVLGPAFGISALPDRAVLTPVRQPDVGQSCFSNAEQRSPTDLHHSIASLQAAGASLRRALHSLTMAFLQNKDTREAMLNWLARALASNAERNKMQPDPRKAASDGFMLNVALVVLQLCEPFIDPLTGKAWARLDARYVSDPASRDPQGPDNTRLAADSEAVSKWAGAGGEGGSGAPYHFICECFFMAAHALRLGLMKTMEHFRNMPRIIEHGREDLEQMEAELRMLPPGSRNHVLLSAQVNALRNQLARYQTGIYCYEAMLSDQAVMKDALAFYRLMSAFMLRLASPTAALGGPPTLPLPDTVPMAFAQLPEYYVEDLCEMLSWVGRHRPDLVEARRMEEFMVFFTVFLGSTKYISNAHLRGKMVEVLHSYMPQGEGGVRPRGWRRPMGRQPLAATEVATLFEVHPLVIANMVQSLVALYIDIEFTGRHGAFYEKFSTRYQIGELLEYLWKLPQHRTAWQAVARDDKKLYVRFINMMINDSQHQLQEALETLPKVQETERLQEDHAAWGALPPPQRAEREQALAQQRNIIGTYLYYATISVGTMQYTSEDRVVGGLFFEPEVRDRMARNLDFFLKYLTVPSERKKLKIRDPEKYHWRPRELITSLASIHLNLYRAQSGQWAEAVAADTDYYGNTPSMFPELLSVLRGAGLAGEGDIADLERMVAHVEQTKAASQAEEELMGDIPEDFVDLVTQRIMRDPVKLPSGYIVDRPTIVQQLLNDPRDPFTRMPLSEEDLEPQPELAQRIADWVAEQRAARMQE